MLVLHGNPTPRTPTSAPLWLPGLPTPTAGTAAGQMNWVCSVFPVVPLFLYHCSGLCVLMYFWYLSLFITCLSVVPLQSSGLRETSSSRSSTRPWEKWRKRAAQNETLPLRLQHTQNPSESHLGLVWKCWNKVWFATMYVVSLLLNSKQPRGRLEMKYHDKDYGLDKRCPFGLG